MKNKIKYTTAAANISMFEIWRTEFLRIPVLISKIVVQVMKRAQVSSHAKLRVLLSLHVPETTLNIFKRLKL